MCIRLVSENLYLAKEFSKHKINLSASEGDVQQDNPSQLRN